MKQLSLLYHRVNNLAVDPWTTSVSPAHFAEQLSVIARMSPRPVVTFDDGYADNLQFALPCLERFDVSARIFLTSDAIGSDFEMWWDDLDQLFLEGEPNFEIDDPELTPRQEAYRRWFRQLRKLHYLEQEEELLKLFKAHNKHRGTRPNRRMLTAEETLHLASSRLVEIGAHTKTHPVLSLLSPYEQEQEIRGSKYALQKLLDRPVDGFAYPNGMPCDYTTTTIALVKAAGFRYSYSAFPNDASDPFQLGRIMVRDWDGDEFSRVLTEVGASS